MPSYKILPTVAKEADRLESEINAARLTLDEEVGIWSVYGDHGLAPAQHVLAAMKEAKSPMLMRQKVVKQKAAPGMVSVELPMGMATALAAARANEGDLKVEQALNYIAGPGQQVSASGTLTDSGPQSKPVAKKAFDAKTDLLAIAFGADQAAKK